MGQNKFADALKSLQSAQSLGYKRDDINDKLSQAQYGVGLVFFEKRNFSKAAEHFDKALLLNPRSSVINCKKGEALLEQGKFADAFISFKEACAFGSKDVKMDELIARAFLGHGKVFFQKANYKKAIEQFKVALDYKKDDPVILAYLAIAHAKQEDFLSCNKYLTSLNCRPLEPSVAGLVQDAAYDASLFFERTMKTLVGISDHYEKVCPPVRIDKKDEKKIRG